MLLPQDHLGPDYKVLNRVPLTNYAKALTAPITIVPHEIGTIANRQPTMTLAIIDLETTGLDAKTHEVIELGIVIVEADAFGPIRVSHILNMLNEPKYAISDEITRITGITNEMVKGHRIDVTAVANILSLAQFAVAHNAGFDRPFFETHLLETNLPWYCSSRGGEIDWKALGYKSSGLESIVEQQGMFYDAHRASIDCIATMFALCNEPAAWAQLMTNGPQDMWKILAWGSPFAVKDQLKAAGYSWDLSAKVWSIQVHSEEKAFKQKEFLEGLYVGAAQSVRYETIPFQVKYKANL